LELDIGVRFMVATKLQNGGQQGFVLDQFLCSVRQGQTSRREISCEQGVRCARTTRTVLCQGSQCQQPHVRHGIFEQVGVRSQQFLLEQVVVDLVVQR